jgi:hypothetical protein
MDSVVLAAVVGGALLLLELPHAVRSVTVNTAQAIGKAALQFMSRWSTRRPERRLNGSYAVSRR